MMSSLITSGSASAKLTKGKSDLVHKGKPILIVS
jgi:hypothetical protein